MNTHGQGVRYVPPGAVLRLAERARVQGVSVHVIDCFARPDISDRNSLYLALAESFAFPEYFGYNLDALWDMLTEQSWWNGGHDLFLAVRPGSALVAELERLVPLFDEVCRFYAHRGLRFNVYIVDGPIALSRPAL